MKRYQKVLEKRYPQKRILITGAGSGLGRALCIEFARMRWNIAAVDIDLDASRETCREIKELGGEGISLSCDVSSYGQMKKMRDMIARRWGGLDILVNNAGISHSAPQREIEVKAWDQVIDINLRGVIWGCNLFLDMLCGGGGGHIVNVSSYVGLIRFPEGGCYGTAKAGVIALSETLRMEFSSKKLGVTVVCPSFFRTNLVENTGKIAGGIVTERNVIMNRVMMEKASVTAEDIAHKIGKAIRSRKFYLIPMLDARALWIIKRLWPVLYLRITGFLYRKGLYERMFGGAGLLQEK